MSNGNLIDWFKEKLGLASQGYAVPVSAYTPVPPVAISPPIVVVNPTKAGSPSTHPLEHPASLVEGRPRTGTNADPGSLIGGK